MFPTLKVDISAQLWCLQSWFIEGVKGKLWTVTTLTCFRGGVFALVTAISFNWSRLLLSVVCVWVAVCWVFPVLFSPQHGSLQTFSHGLLFSILYWTGLSSSQQPTGFKQHHAVSKSQAPCRPFSSASLVSSWFLHFQPHCLLQGSSCRYWKARILYKEVRWMTPLSKHHCSVYSFKSTDYKKQKMSVKCIKKLWAK